MKQLTAVLLFFATVARAQWAPVPPTSFPALDAVLNAKMAFTVSPTAPENCAAGKEVYIDGAQKWYLCVAENTWAEIVTAAQTYMNPAFIGSLAWSKLTGVPNFEPEIAAGTTAQYWRGDKSWQALTTDTVVEGTNLFFTAARVRGALSALPPLQFNSLTGAFSLPAATSGQSGYLTAADWAIFAAKQNALNAAGVVTMFAGCSGTLYLGADGACHSLPSAPVSSVFGRTGAVTAQAGDYTASQITNAVDTTVSYSNPAWINSLAFAKLTGVPSFVDQAGSYANPSWLTSLAWAKLTGVPSFAQSATTDTTNASNITSGTLLTGIFPAFLPLASGLSIGANPSTSGAIRLSNGLAITMRNFANSGDMGLLDVTGAGVMRVGYSGVASVSIPMPVTLGQELTVGGTVIASNGTITLPANQSVNSPRFLAPPGTATCSSGGVTLGTLNTNVRVNLGNQASCTVTLPSASNGQFINLLLCNGGTTATTTIAWTGVKGGMTTTGTTNQCAGQAFMFDSTNSAWYALGAGSAWN